MSISFWYFVKISPWKERNPSFEETWIPFTQGCIVPTLVEFGPVILEKITFPIKQQCIFAISYLSPLRKRQSPLFQQNWIPFTERQFMPSLVEIGPVVLEKKILKIFQCIFAISWLSPNGKRRALHLNKLVEWFYRTRWKCEMFSTTTTTMTTTTTTTTDNGQILLRKPHLRLKLRWAKRKDDYYKYDRKLSYLKEKLFFWLIFVCFVSI